MFSLFRVSAINSTITVTLSNALSANPTVTAFAVTQSGISGGALNVTPSAVALDSTGKVVTLTVPTVVATTADQSVVYSVSYKGGAVVVAPKFTVAKASLIVNSVDVISNTSVSVVLASSSDAVNATDKDGYTVKIGEVVVPVTAVTYTAATNTAVLTVDLDKKEGKVAVNAVESTTFDYKAPEIKAIKAVSSKHFDITYSEAVNAALAQLKSNYSLVQAGTANILTGEVTGVTVLNPTQVRVSVNTAKLVKDTSYTVSVSNMQDMSANKNTMTVASSINFVAIKDETKPTLVSAIATDANKIVLTMSEEIKTSGTATVKKYKADGTLDTAVDNTVALDSTDKTKMIVTITGSADYMLNGSNYQVTIANGSDLEGNAIEASQKSNVAGLRDDVAPTVVSATMLSTDDTKLVVTFSEKIKSTGFSANNYVVANANTGEIIGVQSQTPGIGEMANKMTLDLESSTVKGISYRVYVASGISDLAVIPNLVDTDNATALFTGIDTVPVDVSTATRKLTSESTMTLNFEEILDPSSVTAADFSVDDLTVTNAVVQANGTDVILTFAGTDTALNPTVKLVAGANIADISGNEATGASGGTVIAGVYTDAAKPYLVKAEVTPTSGAIIVGGDGLYSVKESDASNDAIGDVTVIFSEVLDPAKLTLEVYDATGKVTLGVNELAAIKTTLLGDLDSANNEFTNNVAVTYANAKNLIRAVAGDKTITKLVFSFEDGSKNNGAFTFLID